jgi:glycosyltransferase involved in cell wall biosynthesis
VKTSNFPKNKWPEIAIIGSYPPPYGGISVHLKRFCKYLDKEGFDYVLFNTVTDSERPPRIKSVRRYKLFWFLHFCMYHQSSIVHLHSINWYSRLMIGIVSKFREGKYILTFHGRSQGESLRSSNPLKSSFTRWYTRKMDRIIAVNPYIKKECADFVGINNDQIIVAPAFVPPDIEDASILSGEIKAFFQSYQPVLFGVGWVGQTYMGEDTYGIDMMVELVDRLHKRYPNIGLALAINGGKDAEINKVSRICHYRFGDRILILNSVEDISRIMQASTIFLRPTNTDGDAVSIREAIHLGVPVVASDAVPRPDACRTFTNRDMNDFEHTVCDVLVNLEKHKEAIKNSNMPDNVQPILDVYSKLLNKRS